jgi:hypothetical protein
VSIAQARVPAIVASSVVFLVVGMGAGAALMSAFTPHWRSQLPVAPPMSGMGPAEGAPAGGAKAKGGGAKAKGDGEKAKGQGAKAKSGGPDPKPQLALLVDRLALLTGKPVGISLSDEQKKKVLEQIDGLEAKTSLDAEDAQKRLDALIDVLKDHRETFEAIGYRWPGTVPPMFRATEPPNPFLDQQRRKQVQALREQFTGKPAASPKSN